MTEQRHSSSPSARVCKRLPMVLMRWFTVWLCATFVGSVLPLQAQVADTANSQNPIVQNDAQMRIGRIGLIDLEGVLRAASGTAKVRELLDEQRLRFQREFSAKETSLQETERRLVSERELLSDEAFAERLSEFEAEVAAIQKEIQYRREAIDAAFQEAQASLRRLALEIVTNVAREKRLDLVLTKESALIFRPGLNISDEVLTRLDERTKNAKFEIRVDDTGADGASQEN